MGLEDNILIEVGLPIALFVIMIGIGLTLTTGDFRREARAPKALIVGSVAQLLIMPAFGFAIAAVLDLSPALAVGLVIAAACPGGATSNLVVFLGKANVALSIVLTVIASLAVIVTLPIAGNLALGIWPALDGAVRVPVGQTIALLLGVVLVPVTIGMVIRRRNPEQASALERVVSIFGGVVLVVLVAAIIWSVRDEFWTLMIQAGLSTTILNLGGIAIGMGVGVLAGLSRTDALTCGTEMGVKNTTLGMMIALTILGSGPVAIPSAVYGLVMYLSAIGIVAYGRRLAEQRSGLKEPARPLDEPSTA
jgi:bile acid:Na+ symporter, BASS family